MPLLAKCSHKIFLQHHLYSTGSSYQHPRQCHGVHSCLLRIRDLDRMIFRIRRFTGKWLDKNDSAGGRESENQFERALVTVFLHQLGLFYGPHHDLA